MTKEVTEFSFDHQGMKVHLIPVKKFKTVQFAIKFKAPLDRETITKRALLTFLLEQGTSSYPSEKQLMQYLDELYGAVLSVEGQKKGNEHILTVRLEVANEKYIANEETMLQKTIQLLHEVIFSPNLDGETFPEKIVAREKRTLEDKIEAIKDDKMSYANMRLMDHMCEDEAFSIHAHGYAADLKEIDAASLTAYYRDMLKTDAVDLYVVGDVDQEKITTFIQHQFSQEWSGKHPTKQEQEMEQRAIQEVIEVQEVNQAKLHIGYRTTITYQDDAYFALHVFNGLFGGFPSSKLFMNVREKHSLAYYAASRIESHKGLLIVFSGIEPADYKKAREIIEQQLQAVRDGDFTDEEVEDIKALIISDIEETLDHLSGTVELFYQQVVGQKPITPKQFLEHISKVTKQDVVEVAKQLKPDTVYLLTNRKEEPNEA